MARRSRIVIADDHALFRDGVKAVLDLHSDVTVVAQVGRADDILPALKRTHGDILLLDLRMDRGTLRDIPTLAARASVIVVTADEDPSVTMAALRAGARGVVQKRFAADTLIDAVRAVACAGVWMTPSLQADLVASLQHPVPELTARECEVVRHVARGLRNAEIAKQIFVSESTVKTHLNNILQKLKLRGRVELSLYALRCGLVDITDLPK